MCASSGGGRGEGGRRTQQPVVRVPAHLRGPVSRGGLPGGVLPAGGQINNKEINKQYFFTNTYTQITN